MAPRQHPSAYVRFRDVLALLSQLGAVVAFTVGLFWSLTGGLAALLEQSRQLAALSNDLAQIHQLISVMPTAAAVTILDARVDRVREMLSSLMATAEGSKARIDRLEAYTAVPAPAVPTRR